MTTRTSITVDTSTRSELSRLAAQLGGVLGVRVSNTNAVRIAVYITQNHLANDAHAAAIALGIIQSDEELGHDNHEGTPRDH